MKLTIFSKKIDIKVFIGVFIAAILLMNLLYYLNFHGLGISKSTTVWAEYGSYIAGVTSILNLIVFIFLTVYVAQLGDENSKKQLELQERQIKTQSKILLAQFRQSELLKLSELLSAPFENYTIKEIRPYYEMFSTLYIKTINYLGEPKTLFPILKEPDIRIKVSSFYDEVNKLANVTYLIKNLKYMNLPPETKKDFSSIAMHIQNLKDELIEIIQTSIIKDLETND